MINRFIQLREISSTFDENNNVKEVVLRSSNDRPLAKYLSMFKNKLYWVLMTAKNNKKLYSAPDQILDNGDDYEVYNQVDELNTLSTSYSHYTEKIRRQQQPNIRTETQINIGEGQLFNDTMRPSNTMPINDSNDAFARPSGIIVNANVDDDINAIVDNLGDLYSSVVDKNKIMSRRFVIQKYNLAHKHLQGVNLKGSNFKTRRVKVLGNDDPISINGIVTLPEPTVKFSQINMPGSSLLVKANLNMQFLNYWQLLKKQTNLTKIVIDSLDTELDYNGDNFVDNVKQYVLNLTDYNRNDEITNLEIYQNFLSIVVPKIKNLFNLVKKYIKGRLSFIDVVNYLEPFLVYPIDITYTQQKDINDFVIKKISEYQKKFKEYENAFRLLNVTPKSNYVSSILRVIMPDSIRLHNPEIVEIVDSYGIDRFKDEKNINFSDSERLKHIISTDYGLLFNTTVALSNIELMHPSDLSAIFEKDRDDIKEIIENKRPGNCSEYIIAKKYYSKESLEKDNGTNIYFDREYDTTNYDLIATDYKKERSILEDDDLITWLTEELKNKKKMDEFNAEYMAKTLVNQAKEVLPGQYAILIVDDNSKNGTNPTATEMQYYVRNDNNEWELDSEVNPSIFVKDSDVLCNMSYDCVYDLKNNDEKCISTDENKDKIVQNALKQIMNEFDEKYNISKADLHTKIVEKANHAKSSFKKLMTIKDKHYLKYNDIKYKLGMSITSEIENKIVSPYKNLIDLIMGQTDFVKRQSDIIDFVNMYCYVGDSSTPNINDGEMENEWWYYCKETHTKLLPKFYHILAYTFVYNSSGYLDKLEELKKEIGKRSDDGDSWVDENSGHVICFIDMDVSESYEDGFVSKSREVMEKDFSETIIESQIEKKDTKRLSEEGKLISNVISTLSHNMGIDIESSRDFIIRIVSELMANEKVVAKESTYKKALEDAEKKGKKLPSYAMFYSTNLIYLTLGSFIFAIQTSIPSINTKKTAPNCTKSFVGYPYDAEGDDSALIYLACVALKSRDKSTVPWNALSSNSESIVNNIKKFITKNLINHKDIMQRIIDKTQYLLTNPSESIPEEHDLTKWSTFLPPLKRFYVRSLENVSESFMTTLINDIKIGHSSQHEKMLSIKSKIIAYSLAIQESIQDVVERQNLLLKTSGKTYMDNACCNDNNNVSTLEYFINKDNQIGNYNNIVTELNEYLHELNGLIRAPTIISKIDSKRKFSEIVDIFSEETIYRAFIILCKFQTSVPLSNELIGICGTKPDYINKMETIQEKIMKLKRDGRDYTKERFLKMFQVISKNNLLKLKVNKLTKTCLDNLTDVINRIKEDTQQTILPKQLIKGFDYLTDNYDVVKKKNEKYKELDNLKDYLSNSITNQKKKIKDFIKTKNVLSLELKKISKFLDELGDWNFNKSTRNSDIKISNDGLYNSVQFFRNFIHLFALVFPNMILNKREQKIISHKYWKLSKIHEEDLSNIVEKFYEPLNQFMGNNVIENVLKAVSQKNNYIYLLSQNTPALSEININDVSIDKLFDSEITAFLYEYYLLNILTDYIDLSRDIKKVSKILAQSDVPGSYQKDFLLEQESQLDERDNEYIKGDLLELKNQISNLLVTYLKIMMKSKKQINVSYENIQDKVFRDKEYEKYDFTDKLKGMSDESRELDTTFKLLGLGIYSIGESKGLREYDQDHFEFDRETANRIQRLERKANRLGVDADDIDYNEELDAQAAREEGYELFPTEDGDDNDPFGEYDNDDY
jgi:hypothetical protein